MKKWERVLIRVLVWACMIFCLLCLAAAAVFFSAGYMKNGWMDIGAAWLELMAARYGMRCLKEDDHA